MFGVQNFMRGAANNLPTVPKPEEKPTQPSSGQENLLAQKVKAPDVASQGLNKQLNNAIFQ